MTATSARQTHDFPNLACVLQRFGPYPSLESRARLNPRDNRLGQGTPLSYQETAFQAYRALTLVLLLRLGEEGGVGLRVELDFLDGGVGEFGGVAVVEPAEGELDAVDGSLGSVPFD